MDLDSGMQIKLFPNCSLQLMRGCVMYLQVCSPANSQAKAGESKSSAVQDKSASLAQESSATKPATAKVASSRAVSAHSPATPSPQVSLPHH